MPQCSNAVIPLQYIKKEKIQEKDIQYQKNMEYKDPLPCTSLE